MQQKLLAVVGILALVIKYFFGAVHEARNKSIIRKKSRPSD